MKLVDYIGKPAMLEQTAEEAVELAHACLKLARMLRGENKVHNKVEEELINNILEEIADLTICFDQLCCGDITSPCLIEKWRMDKYNRMRERLDDSKNLKEVKK